MNRFIKFLTPSGYLHSKYNQYVGWSFVSTILVSAETVLAADSVLTSVDIGDSQVLRTASYMGKDIIGQLGSLWYISKVGNQADIAPTNFIRSSNCLQQVSYGLICLTPLFPQSYFLPIAGLGNMMGTIAFTGFGAINGKCIQNLERGNIGEIFAKISAVNTLGSSIGMLLGIGILSAVPDHSARLSLIPILGISRYYTFNWAIKGVL